MATTARAHGFASVRRSRELSEKTKTERRLGFLLTTPAVVVLLAVAAYPIANAAYLSLFNYRLTAPDQRLVSRLEP